MESPLMIGQQPIQCNRTAMKSSLIPQAMTYTNQPALDLTIWELPDRPTGVIYLPIEWETIIQNCSLSHPSCANSCPVVLSSILIALWSKILFINDSKNPSASPSSSLKPCLTQVLAFSYIHVSHHWLLLCKLRQQMQIRGISTRPEGAELSIQ